MIERKTDKVVIGVIPHNGDLGLDEEDGLAIESTARFKHTGQDKKIKVVVPRLKYISNFTDFAPFLYEPDVEFKYSVWHEDMASADVIIIPGSKNTVSDLLLLRENGLEDALKSAVKKGIPLVGICGGYQMLGKKIIDSHSVESSLGEIDGIGLLDTTTTLDRKKTTCQVSAELMNSKGVLPYAPAKPGEDNTGLKNLKGYEIHMGNTTGDVGLFTINRLHSANPSNGRNDIPDGSVKDNVWGTYIHGIFDNDEFRRMFLNALREKKGLPLQNDTINHHAKKQEAIDAWAGTLGSKVDICFILRQLAMESFQEKYCTTMRHE
jgi:adenosylcobyric acid synthase